METTIVTRILCWPVMGCVFLWMIFNSVSQVAYAQSGDLPPPGECPQPRFTDKAPAKIYNLINPIEPNTKNIKAAKKLYRSASQPISCSKCHGRKGDGKGAMARLFDPPPRNFACAATIKNIPDGQLFWIIKNGSPDTAMPAFADLSDRQIWQLVLYLRKLANSR